MIEDVAVDFQTADVLGVRCDSVAHILAARARKTGGRVALTFLAPGHAAVDLTYGALDSAARRLAVALRRVARPRQRVLLLIPPGAEFPKALFGVFYAGMIAVPAALPDSGRLERTMPRLRAVALDARPAVVLTTAASLPLLRHVFQSALPQLGALPLIAVDGIDLDAAPAELVPLDIGPESLAFLQYTSGSTAAPKGVMISHGSLMAGAFYLKEAWHYREESRALLWVPDFHDDGLVHGNVLPIYSGHPCWRMPAAEIVRRPLSWLEAIGQHRISHSGGPNFAYELCVRRIPEEARSGLDLGSWRMAYNAAEPVRASTLERFSEAFAPHGFSPDSHFPAYGLAEAALLVTTRRWEDGLRVLDVDVEALEHQGRVLVCAPGQAGSRSLVACGAPVADNRLEIVHPETLERLVEGRVGEVFVSSQSLASGYWSAPEISRATFIDGFGSPPARFLRTGDLGFLWNGELFITGRLKDLIIIRGRNLYPQDVELTAEESHPSLRRGCGAAFSTDIDGEERLVVIQEIRAEPGTSLEKIGRGILQRIVEEHDVRPHTVVLIPPGVIFKTSSGKIQRSSCRDAFLGGHLKALEVWSSSSPVPQEIPDDVSGRRRADEIITWLRAWSESRVNSRLMDERRSMAPHVVLDLGNRGLFGLAASPVYGGQGLAMCDVVRIFQQLGAIDLTIASFVIGQNLLGVHPIEKHAGEEVKRRFLPALTSGRQLSALALTEEGAGSNPRSLDAAGRWDEATETWLLEGTKVWSGTAAWAGVVSVFVRLDGGPGGGRGITAFVLDRDRPGLRIGPECLTMGLRAMVQSSVHLEGVRASVEDLLGTLGGGIEVAQDAFALARLGIGAMAIGCMKRCAQLMVRYARQRTIATGLLLDHPVTLDRLGELAASITALECLVEDCARQLDATGRLPTDAVMTCKIAGAEWLWHAADDLVQTLGGRGYAEPNGAPQILRDARLLRIFEGSTETLLAHLGSRAANGEKEIFNWLAARDPKGADELWSAISRVEERPSEGSTGETALAQRLRLHQQLGELTHWAILRAAVFAARTAQEPASLQHAADWLDSRFRRLRKSFEEGENGGVLLAAEGVAALVSSYGDAIGSSEQLAADEDRLPDLLLRRKAGGIPEAVVPPVVEAVPEKSGDASTWGESRALAGRDKEIESWLIEWIARHLELDRKLVAPDAPLSTFVDSVIAVMMIGDLGEWLGTPLDPGLPWSFPSIEALSCELAAHNPEPPRPS